MLSSWRRRSWSLCSEDRDSSKMLGKGQSAGFPVEASSEFIPSLSSGLVDSTNKKGLLQGNVPTAAPPQSQLLLTPASLQLAQLQAQITLQRLKLAQGGNSASAAVLNQVLSSMAMSQPLFNHLRASSMVGNPQSTFTSGVLGFPSSNSTLSVSAGGVFNQSSSSLHPNQPIRGSAGAQQTLDYGKKTGSAYPSDADRRVQYNVIGGTSVTASTDRQYSLINTQVKNVYGQDIKGQQAGFSLNEPSAYDSTVQSDHWKGTVSHAGNCEASNTGPLWTAAGQPHRSRPDLYNPEEPTSDPKFNPSGMQGFGGYQARHGSTELKIIQPHQVNDYYSVTPSHLPHQCSICDKKVYNLKDWEQHVKGKLHLQNKTQYNSESSAVASTGAVHYSVGRSLEAPVSSGQANSMVFTTTGQDGSSGGISSFLPAAAMKTFPLQDTGFTALQLEPKSFPPRKGTVGRVVHICNLPEGSCTENDVINLGLPFGKVTNYILMRSTHQAFLEMAYVEAALAMVQYHQLTPAMINNHKLLIRMSKRYKELQLKKPGKDVETIIYDITSQRERDEIQEHDHYIPDRARSRSPISRALSPHIHSPGFNCEAPESPQGTACRVAERGANGLVPIRNTWDWSTLPRRAVDEREGPWQNGCCGDEERTNGWGTDRRKTYQKLTDHMNLRCAEERGGSRDWHPQRISYRNMEDSYYTKEQIYKSDKPLRPPYQRHDPKSKRREADYHRPRHSELDTSSEPSRTEDKRSSPERGRSKKTTKKHNSTERHSKERTTEHTDQQSKEKSVTPQRSTPPKENNDGKKIEMRDVENAEDTDEEIWYPKNMEELVTVDEVGGEDDIIEPDLPELEESANTESVQEEGQHNVSVEVQESDVKDEKSSVEAGSEENLESDKSAQCPEESKSHTPTIKDLNDFQSEFKAMIEDSNTTNGVIQKEIENRVFNTEEDKLQETETLLNGAQDIEALVPSCEQDKAVNEHSIPLGVEFIVPQAGFYCKLCSLFYTSEETAKAAHCRSVVHYRNLQKYLSHLAEESLFDQFSGSSPS